MIKKLSKTIIINSREIYQRNAIEKGLNKYRKMIGINDVDEIKSRKSEFK